MANIRKSIDLIFSSYGRYRRHHTLTKTTFWYFSFKLNLKRTEVRLNAKKNRQMTKLIIFNSEDGNFETSNKVLSLRAILNKIFRTWHDINFYRELKPTLTMQCWQYNTRHKIWNKSKTVRNVWKDSEEKM